MKQKILCIQLKQIGDVLMTTPAVRALSEHFADAEIHFLTQAPSHQIYEHNPYVEKVIQLPRDPKFGDFRKVAGEVRKEGYDIVVDFFGQGQSAFISWWSKAPTRIGFNFRGRKKFYTHALDLPEGKDYSPFHKMHLLTALGIEAENPQIDFFVSSEDKEMADSLFKKLGVDSNRPVVTVSPVSRRDYKVWPAENFALICDRLVEQYHAQILFLWGPGEEHFIQAVQEKMKSKSLPDYDIPTIRETVAILEKADFHLGNDNGPMHFAVAARRKTVAVFGRPVMINWTPPNSVNNLAIEHDPGCKHSCHYPECGLECIKDVSVEETWKLVEQQMQT
ncbi:MAG: heptosyltransferase-3 [bacterium]|jgi:heptosyltransferase-3